MNDVRSIQQEHVSKAAPVLVETVSLERHVYTKNQLRGRLLRSLPVGLAFLRTVYAAQADAFGALVVQDFQGVAVEDVDDLTGETAKTVEAVRRSREQQVSRCIINRIRRKDSAARHNTKRVPSRTHTRRHAENSSRAAQPKAICDRLPSRQGGREPHFPRGA